MNDTPQGKILLVDDDNFLLQTYATKFTHDGYATQACLSVDDAIQAIKGGFEPDVIMFDLLMPERDGFSFLTALSSEHLAPKAIRIALTNQSDEAERVKAESLGANRYIVKASMIPSEVVNIVGEELKAHSKA